MQISLSNKMNFDAPCRTFFLASFFARAGEVTKKNIVILKKEKNNNLELKITFLQPPQKLLGGVQNSYELGEWLFIAAVSSKLVTSLIAS